MIMLNRSVCLALCCGLVVVFTGLGCSQQTEKLNSPPQGYSERQNAMQGHFTYMTDKALLNDSSVADVHFEPHGADLSGLGVRRLTRLGELLSRCGGIVRYESDTRDEALIASRLDAVRSFLASSGVDMERITVEFGMSRSKGISATEAIAIKEAGTEGTSGGSSDPGDTSGMSM